MEETFNENVESSNPFDTAQREKEDMLLAEKLMQSGLLYTKKGRKMLGINLKPYKKDYPDVGRNSLCQCGSGKKNKKCCQL